MAETSPRLAAARMAIEAFIVYGVVWGVGSKLSSVDVQY